MKCIEFTSLVEEYLDGDLKAQAADRVCEHASSCSACAGVLADRSRENEIYAGYTRDLEVTPDMWHAVRARIEMEKSVPNAPGLLARARASVVESFGLRLRPAFGFAVVLIVLGAVSFAVIRYLNRRPAQEPVATHQEKLPPQPKVQPNPAGNTSKSDIAKEQLPDGLTPETKMGTILLANRKGVGPSAKCKGCKYEEFFLESNPRRKPSRTVGQRISPSPNESTAAMDAAIAENNVSAYMPSGANDANPGIARHVEQAQMLLRSFRNVRLAETSHAPDVAYEKAQSRKLLYQNIVLRREASAQGNEPAEKMLSALEPILLDIANLPTRATTRDVRFIEQRMRKKEIVAALQLHSLQASNSY